MSVAMIAITTRSSTSVKPNVAGLRERHSAPRQRVSRRTHETLDAIEVVKAHPPR